LLIGESCFKVSSGASKITLLLSKLHGRTFQPRTQLKAMTKLSDFTWYLFNCYVYCWRPFTL